MSDGMERIMREIHVMFAKAEKVSSREDMIVVDKKRIFALLESLSHEVYAAMDRYEESKASRELAVQKYREETDAMVERASESAEEIYAASILYSDSTLMELEQEVARARESIQNTWEKIDRQIADRLRDLEKNRGELKTQLESMEQSRVYLDLIGKAKQEEKAEQEEQKRLNRLPEKRKAEVSAEEKREQKAEMAKEPERKEEFEELDGFDVLEDYIEMEDDLLDLDDLDESGLTEEQKKIEIYVADAYKDRVDALKGEKQSQRRGLGKKDEDKKGNRKGEYRAEDFDLDAEYFAWKEEINGAPPSYTADAKKGLKDIFKRIK